MNIKFNSQSGFIIETTYKRFCIDLWLNNPVLSLNLEQIPKMDYVFVTHDHSDHDVDSAIKIAARDNSILFANTNILEKAQLLGVTKVSRGCIGGVLKEDGIEVIQTRADHTSNTGIPLGFIIKIDNKVIYHMGDTGYYAGFDFYKKVYGIDILLVPIGSIYTMGPIEASYAVEDMKPSIVIPMHYNTFPKINQNPDDFKNLVSDKSPNTQVIILRPGESIEV